MQLNQYDLGIAQGTLMARNFLVIVFVLGLLLLETGARFLEILVSGSLDFCSRKLAAEYEGFVPIASEVNFQFGMIETTTSTVAAK